MSTKPEMWDTIRIVFPRIKAKWEFVAYSLHYQFLEVSAFEKDSKDSEKSCLNLFSDWINTNRGITPKTWHTLIKQIKAVDGLYNAAEQIEEEVKKI